MDDQVARTPDHATPDHAEAERLLAGHPQVTAAALAVGGDEVDPQLLAYVVPAGADLPDPGELRRWVTKELPGFAGPDAFVLIDRMPVTGTGAPDTGALARAYRGDTGEATGAPRIVGGTAAEVADIWQEVFGLDRVDLTDDIFDLGGHSLTITRISVQITARLGVDLPLSVFYDTPTVSGIVAAIEEISAAD